MTDFKHRPIFLLSSERSGSNLVRKRISQNQEVYFGGSPVHFLKHLYYSEYMYGDLDIDSNFRSLISDALQLCYVHFSPWTVKYNPEDILEEYSNLSHQRNIILLSHFLMTKYAEDNSRISYFCKDNYVYEFWSQIENELPEARFIYLHRDPRDYVLSQIKRPTSNKNIRRASRLWEYEQTKCLSAYLKLAKKGKCLKIGYEEFISDEKNVLSTINKFLEIPTIKNDLSTDGVVQEVQEWKNLDKPTKTSNKDKYKRELSENKIGLIEAICWKLMKKLDYETENKSRPKVKIIYRAWFELSSLIRMVKLRMQWTINRNENDIIKTRSRLVSKTHANYRKP